MTDLHGGAFDKLRKDFVGTPPDVDAEDVWSAGRIDEAEAMADHHHAAEAAALGRVAAIASRYRDEPKSQLRTSMQVVHKIATDAYSRAPLRGYHVVLALPDLRVGDLGGRVPDHVFLQWLHDRLVAVYGESENLDWVQRLEQIVVASRREAEARARDEVPTTSRA